MDRSDTIAKLASALVAFEADVTNPKNSAENPFHHNRYAPLQDILAYVRPLLAQHKLAVSQLLHSDGDAIGVTTVLMHESGEYIAETATISVQSEKGKSHAQLAGSNVTYLRRYALAAVLGIASEDDDDGNAGLQQRKQSTASEPAKNQKSESPANSMGSREISERAGAAIKAISDLDDPTVADGYTLDFRKAYQSKDRDECYRIMTEVERKAKELREAYKDKEPAHEDTERPEEPAATSESTGETQEEIVF